MHYNTLIEKSCLKGTSIKQQWDNPACPESHMVKAASKLQLSQFSGEHIKIPDNTFHTVCRIIIALIIAVIKVNYVHLFS